MTETSVKGGNDWPYHEDKHGDMVKCRSNPCRLHGGGDIMASSLEDAYRIHDDIMVTATAITTRDGGSRMKAVERLRDMISARHGAPLPVPAMGPNGPVDGVTLPVVGVVCDESSRFPVYEVSADYAKEYSGMLSEVFNGGGFGGQVSEETPESMAGMRMFVAPDGNAGTALASDDANEPGEDPDYVTAVCKRKDCAWPHPGETLVKAAVSEGGRRLDCFNTFLPHLYDKCGFHVVARMAFDEEYAPETWDYEALRKDGFDDHPDVVFMTVGGNPAGERVFDDYDEAQRYAHDTASAGAHGGDVL